MKKVKITKENMKSIKKRIIVADKSVILKKRIEKENNVLREQIIKYLEANSHKYYIFMSSHIAFIVGKSQKLTIYSVNENSVFMPRENKQTKSYLTLMLIHYGSTMMIDKTENMLVDLGCELIHIRSRSEIQPKLG